MTRLHEFLRLPDPEMPEEALTGDPTLDACLRNLDSQLVGSRWVRLATLDGVRASLLECRDRLLAEGWEPSRAAWEAVDRFGPTSDLAARQRRSLRRKFGRSTGAFWGWVVLTALVVVLGATDRDIKWFGFVALCALQIVRSLHDAFRAAYLSPDLVPQDGAVSDDEGESFTVEFPKQIERAADPQWMVVTRRVAGAVFLVTYCAIFWQHHLADDESSPLIASIIGASVIVAVVGLTLIVRYANSHFRYVVDPQGFLVLGPDRVFRRKRHVPWHDVITVAPVPQDESERCRYDTRLANPLAWIQYRLGNGAIETITVYGNMANASRFVREAKRHLALKSEPVKPEPIAPLPA